MAPPVNKSLQGIIDWAEAPSINPGDNPLVNDINADTLDGYHAPQIIALAIAGASLPPTMPGGTVLTATTISSTQINLSWTTVPGATSYKIYRGGGLIQSGVTGNSWPNTGLTPSTPYSYYILATNGFGDSGQSNTANATTSEPPFTSQEFYYPGGTWVCPAGVTSVNLTIAGGGGGAGTRGRYYVLGDPAPTGQTGGTGGTSSALGYSASGGEGGGPATIDEINSGAVTYGGAGGGAGGAGGGAGGAGGNSSTCQNVNPGTNGAAGSAGAYGAGGNAGVHGAEVPNPPWVPVHGGGGGGGGGGSYSIGGHGGTGGAQHDGYQQGYMGTWSTFTYGAGAGGSGGPLWEGGGGGGGGGSCKTVNGISVTPGNSYTITIGGGGDGGCVSDDDIFENDGGHGIVRISV